MAEQRDFPGVQFDFAAEVGTAERGNMLTSQLQNFRVIDKDLTNILAQVITEGANNDITFLMDQKRGRAIFCRFLNRIPVFQTKAQVPLQGFCRFTDACGTHDQSHTFRQFQRGKGFFQLCTVITFDTAGDPTGTRIVRHQYQIASGQADKGGQRSAFVTTFFFINLNNDFLTFT